jgi:mRNA-degrading endonuclease RelE of RelBE toxin-antitoxin system
MYRIIFSRQAEKDLDKIDKKDKPHIFAALFDLREEPHSGKKLKGKLRDYYSLRV